MNGQPTSGIVQQDRTLSDLLESYRHKQADPALDPERAARAAELMKPVWVKLAKLQDPDGFIDYLSTYIQREYRRRHEHSEDPNLTRREKPLCRCSRSRHVCEPKRGEMPSKIRTNDLKYIRTPNPRKLARDYVQSHEGDVVVGEAITEYNRLRADCYSEITQILAMMEGAPIGGDSSDGPQDGPDSHDSGGPPPLDPSDVEHAPASQGDSEPSHEANVETDGGRSAR